MNPNTDYKIVDSPNVLVIEFSDGIKHLEEWICQALERKCVGPFFGGGRLRFEGKSDAIRKIILTTLEALSIDELTATHLAWVEKSQIQCAARKAFLELTPAQFFSEIQKISNSKLVPNLNYSNRFVVVRADALMPVTHFKKLAKLGKWDGKERRFEYALPLTEKFRDGLYAAAAALGRSTKKVTRADIAARRAKYSQGNDKLDMDFAECQEDFGLDFAKQMQKEGRLIEEPYESRAPY